MNTTDVTQIAPPLRERLKSGTAVVDLSDKPRGKPKLKLKETKAQRKRRLAKAKAERLRLRQRLAEDDDSVWTFREWCSVVGVSERQGRNILTSSGGPVVTRISE